MGGGVFGVVEDPHIRFDGRTRTFDRISREPKHMSLGETIPAVLPVDDRPGTPLRFRLLAICALAWLLVAIHGYTNTVCDFDLSMLLMFSGQALVLSWIVATCVARRPLRTWRARLIWISIPCAVGIGVLLAMTEAGLRCRLAMSESALTERAENLLNGEDITSFPSRVGLFWVRKAHIDDGVVYFYTSQSFLNQEGLAYSPQPIGSPPRMAVKQLSGQWYLFVWHF